MMRESLTDDAAHVSAVVQGSRIRLLDRASTGGSTTDTPGHSQGAPEWIRIERSGNTFTLSRSNDGSSWAVMDTRTISMGTMIYIGMAVTGNSTTTLATGVFDNVATTGSGATPTPTATNTPLPTNTPTATNTPVSTNTPTPTNTPPPSPTPAPDVWIKRSSYGIAGQVVAFRVTGDPVSANNGLFYVLSDHLGSTSLLVNSSGGTVTGSTTRYLPFGGYRGTAPSQTITDRDFTGQQENMELGLLFYGARFYVPGIGRFLSADTIVSNPASPQSFNRYAYTRNNPVNRIDPSGHVDCASLGDLSDTLGCNDTQPTISDDPMVDFTGDWSYTDENGETVNEEWKQEHIQQAAVILGRQFANILNRLHPGWNLTPREAFLLVFGGTVHFNHMGRAAQTGIGGFTNGKNSIDVYKTGLFNPVKWAIHELAHAFNHAIGGVGDDMLIASREEYGIPIRTGYSADDQFGFAGTHSPHLNWQQSTAGNDAGEEFADMMIGWAYNQWERRDGIAHSPYSTVWSVAGQGRSDFMTNNMTLWLSLAIDG